MIYYGLISEVKEDKARVVVGDLTTDYLPVLQIGSAYKHSWVPIQEKEQCVILAPYDDINNGCILRGLYYTDHPAPAVDRQKEVTVYSDGTEISYDAENSELYINAVKDITIVCAETVSVTCKDAVINCETAEVTADDSITATTSEATLTADTVLVNSSDIDLGGRGSMGVVTQACACNFLGVPHADVSGIVKASKL